MKIVYSGVQYDHYDKHAGLSFEHNNFYLSLKAMPGIEVVYFPFDRILEIGKKKFNQELEELVKKEQPDLFFGFMLSDEFTPESLEAIRQGTITAAWFSDDHWRFDNYSRVWAPHFDWAITTYSRAVDWYAKAGIKNVIRSQWGVDPSFYKPAGEKTDPLLEISFVGTWSGPRANVITSLKRAGFNVDVYGGGWPTGRLDEENMKKVFSGSKINLGLNPAPGYFNTNSLGRFFFRRSIDKIVPDMHLYRNFQSWLKRGIPQIKARHFEIPSCGGFLMTSMADDLGTYYEIGKEIEVYSDLSDLMEKAKYYLAHEEERQKIAKAGHARTIKDHTYAKRFGQIFKAIGFNYE